MTLWLPTSHRWWSVLDADILTGVVELDSAEHVAMLGDGQCRLTKLFCLRSELVVTAVPVQ